MYSISETRTLDFLTTQIKKPNLNWFTKEHWRDCFLKCLWMNEIISSVPLKKGWNNFYFFFCCWKEWIMNKRIEKWFFCFSISWESKKKWSNNYLSVLYRYSLIPQMTTNDLPYIPSGVSYMVASPVLVFVCHHRYWLLVFFAANICSKKQKL